MHTDGSMTRQNAQCLMRLVATMLPTVWVVDSNCFIHLGSHGDDKAIKDISAACKQMGAALHVTPGVHKEVATVRMKKWNNKPRLLDVIAEILTTTPVSDDQIRGLAQRIGERASPQDVDLSLMVLASRLAGQGEDVVLVSDDYKMTTTGERVHLPFRTCPPSTFFQRLSELGPKAARPRLRGLSRKVRAEEMRYAISRAGQYDIQSKLTWMIDSLLQSKPAPSAAKTDATDDTALVIALQRHLAGETVKKSRLKALAHLPDICAPVSALLQTNRDELSSALNEAQIKMGMGLAPVNAQLSSIAHRAVAPTFSRVETALGLMAKEDGNHARAREHLIRGLHHATLVDDDDAEMNAMFHLGLVELVSGETQKSAELFEASSVEASRIKSKQVQMVLASAIARQLNGDDEAAANHVAHCQTLVEGNESVAAIELENLGNSLLAVGRPVLALEVFDEALECATESTDTDVAMRLTESIARCDAAITGDDAAQLKRMRSLLDKVNNIGGQAAISFAAEVSAIEERRSWQEEPLADVWSDWQDSSALIPDATMEVLRGVKQDDSLLLICYNSEIGNIGIWLPDSDIEAIDASRHTVSINTRIKVAHPPDSLKREHRIRGIVALEDEGAISLQVFEARD